jgi:hypothetical protein
MKHDIRVITLEVTPELHFKRQNRVRATPGAFVVWFRRLIKWEVFQTEIKNWVYAGVTDSLSSLRWWHSNQADEILYVVRLLTCICCFIWPGLAQSVKWRAVGRMTGVQFSERAVTILFVTMTRPDFGAHPASYPMGTGGSYTQRELYRPHRTSLKTAWIFTTSFPTRLYVWSAPTYTGWHSTEKLVKLFIFFWTLSIV